MERNHRMKIIEATVEVDARGMATLQFPAEVLPGPHRVVVVIEEPVRNPIETIEDANLDVTEDAALRAEALRITPSNDRLRAMIGKFSLPPGDYEAEEIPC
jgi:hypothetical protein